MAVSFEQSDHFSLLVIAMEPRCSEPKPESRRVLVDVEVTGLLVSRDLIFTTKIKGTAADLGYSMLVANTLSQAVSIITACRPAVLLVDLTAGEMAESTALKEYQQIARSDLWLVAFGPHVDGDALAAAKAAGFHAVMPRSIFAAKLPQLLRRYYSQQPVNDA